MVDHEYEWCASFLRPVRPVFVTLRSRFVGKETKESHIDNFAFISSDRVRFPFISDNYCYVQCAPWR